MVYYHCIYCNYNGNSKRDEDRHVKSKKHLSTFKLANNIQEPIKVSKVYDCDLCDKQYSSSDSLYKHKKMCAIRRADEVIKLQAEELIKQQTITNTTTNSHNPNTTTATNSHNPNTTTATTTQSHNPVTTTTQSHNTTNTTTNSHNTTTNNTTNITIVTPLGKEDLTMLTDDIKMKILSFGHCAFQKLIDTIYSNHKNVNVHLYNKRRDLVRYLEGNNIRVGKRKDIILAIAELNADLLDLYYDELHDDMGDHDKYLATLLHEVHRDTVKRAEKMIIYKKIVECKINEMERIAKRNFGILLKNELLL